MQRIYKYDSIQNTSVTSIKSWTEWRFGVGSEGLRRNLSPISRYAILKMQHCNLYILLSWGQPFQFLLYYSTYSRSAVIENYPSGITNFSQILRKSYEGSREQVGVQTHNSVFITGILCFFCPDPCFRNTIPDNSAVKQNFTWSYLSRYLLHYCF